jgi:ABC-type polysaccharide/polyol phosphate export permease
MMSHLTEVIRVPRTLVRHRYLLGQLAWRAFAARHAGSYLGWLWTPVATAVQFALYLVVFSAILKVRVVGLGIDLAGSPPVGFGLFLITGLVPFLAVNDVVVRAVRVFRDHASLVQRVRMPVEVLVVGDSLGVLMHHGFSLALVVLYCLFKGHLHVANLPWIALGLGILVLGLVGVALCVSLLGVVFPDLSEVVALILQVLFYAAPIVYPLALVPSQVVRTLIALNPLTSLIGVMRTGLLGAAPVTVSAVAFLVVGVLAALIAGSAGLSRWRGSIADAV